VRDYSITIDIEADPSSVWRVMRDVQRWHEWTASVLSAELSGGGPLRVGARVRIRQPKLPPAVWEVTELDEDRGFTWVSRGPGVLVTARHVIQRVDGVSRVTLSIHYAGALGGVLSRMTKRFNERYIAMEAEGLKRRVEATQAGDV